MAMGCLGHCSWRPLTPQGLAHGVSEYLLVDDRRTAAIRARLRHDRSSLNASLAIRRVIADPNCASCGVPETNEHCLLDCPAFAVPRLQCSLGLSMLSVDLDLSSVLGDVDRPKSSQDRRPTAVRCEILKLTGAFLRDIDSVRQL